VWQKIIIGGTIPTFQKLQQDQELFLDQKSEKLISLLVI